MNGAPGVILVALFTSTALDPSPSCKYVKLWWKPGKDSRAGIVTFSAITLGYQMYLERNGTMARYLDVDANKLDTVNVGPALFRELVIAGMVSSGPGVIVKYMPTPGEVDTIADMLLDAVTNGRVIDFGHWPNDLIKSRSGRASELYHQNALGHAFMSPWIFTHTWSDPVLDSKLAITDEQPNRSSYYLVHPLLEADKAIGCDFEITAIEPMIINDKKILCIGDRALLLVQDKPKNAKYAIQCIPNHFRLPIEYWNDYARAIGRPEGPDGALQDAGANVIEPIMIALLILNTRGIPQETIRASDKLQKARAKNKKPPIPDYRKIDSRPYVTAIMSHATGARREHQGGHHASPIPHIRIGHWRNYKTGERTFINDTLVKASDEMRAMFKSNRAMYSVKE